MSDLTQALLAFQRDAPAIAKDAVNPHFRNKFASLENVMETVRPLLNANGLVLMQFPTVMESGDGATQQGALRTTIVHAESGEAVEDIMLLHAPKDDPQGQGSALTYARRYAILSILGLVADEDDDGNKAQRRKSAGLLAEEEALIRYAREGQSGANAATESATSDSPPDSSPAENPAEKARKAQAARSQKKATVTQIAKIDALIGKAAGARDKTEDEARTAIENDYGPIADLTMDKAVELAGKLERWAAAVVA